MRKRIFLAAAALLCLLPLFGCTRMVEDEPIETQTVYASFQPIYYLTNELMTGAEKVELRRLTQPLSGCPRAYQLSEWDAVLLGGADIVVMAGAGFESFEGYLTSGELEGGPVAISILDGIDLLTTGEEATDEDSSHFDGPNPWLFLSIEGSMEMIESLSAQLMYVDAENAAVYEHNAEHLIEELDALLSEMKLRFFDVGDPRVAVFHEGLAYLAADFGFDIDSTFIREPGTDYADGEEQVILDQLSEAEIEVALIESHAPDRLVRSLEGVGIAIARIDTMTLAQEEKGERTHLMILRSNALSVLDAFEAVK